MTGYQAIYDVAADNFGLVTSREAKALGVSDKALNALARRGRLERRGHGVYRLVHYIPTPMDRYAEALALVGEGAVVCGESVLAINDLALVEPSVVSVRAARRCRRTLPGWVRLEPALFTGERAFYEGIPCQPVADAIRAVLGRVLPERLADAVRAAFERGLLSRREAAALRKEVEE